jgi:peptidoglycan/LPS O-acetylase OafA/YrhL
VGDDRARERLTYAPALDGLRAVACLGVMLYHAKYLHGGFLGVDIFFTLSGFLITSLLLDQLRADGTVDLRAFWRRRVYRIIPLLAVVTLTWFVWGSVRHDVPGYATVAGAVASLLFATNWLVAHFGGRAAGALAANWSVAMEEQFYLCWPPVLSALYRWRRSERAIAGVVVAVAAGLALHRYAVAPALPWSRGWFGIDTQADALLVGCAAALGLRCRSRWAGIAAAAVLAGLLVHAGDSGPVTLGLLLPATTLATAVLVPVLVEHGGPLAWPPLRAMGRRSYGLYLWSCPINYVALEVYGLRGPLLLAVVFGTTFAVSEVTYRLVEVPLRRLGRRPGPAGRSRRSRASVTVPAAPLPLSPGRP